MLVSVLVPVYNVEKYVAACIDSILAQTYKDLEILLIDDGSEDGSSAICKEYAAKDKRITYLPKPHSGLSETREYGLQHMTGEFFIYVDSDDTISPNLISEVLPLFDENTDVVEYGLESPNIGYGFHLVEKMNLDLSDFDVKMEFLLNALFGNKNYFSVCNKMYRTKLIKENDIHPLSNVIIGEDLAFNLQVYMLAKGYVSTDKIYYHYFYRGDSLMNKDGGMVYYFNDFCNMLYVIREKFGDTLLGRKHFTHLFLRAMDNQFDRRQQRKRDSLVTDIRKIENRDFFREEALGVVLHPQWVAEIYKGAEIRHKILDYSYCLLCLLGK